MAERPLTEEEIYETARRQDLVGFPKLALMRERLSAKAKSEPRFAFFNLYRHVVREDTIRCAWQIVKANGGGPGVDGVTIESIEWSEEGVEGFLKGIIDELHAKTYRASPVRRKYIEKANGKQRPLGIPTIKDRVVQTAVKLIIEPIFEVDFHDYEFRRVKDRHYGTGGTYIETCAAMKSVKKVCKKVKEITSSRMKSVPMADVVKKVNLVIDGWGRYYRYGYPSRMFAKVNWYVNKRLYNFMRRRSQRKYRLKYATTYGEELRHYGLILLTRKRYRQ